MSKALKLMLINRHTGLKKRRKEKKGKSVRFIIQGVFAILVFEKKKKKKRYLKKLKKKTKWKIEQTKQNERWEKPPPPPPHAPPLPHPLPTHLHPYFMPKGPNGHGTDAKDCFVWKPTAVCPAFLKYCTWGSTDVRTNTVFFGDPQV